MKVFSVEWNHRMVTVYFAHLEFSDLRVYVFFVKPPIKSVENKLERNEYIQQLYIRSVMVNLFFCFFLDWFSNCGICTVRIILKTLKVLRLEALRNPSHGKITFINASSQMILVHLSPTVTWSHFERRTNETLRANPDRRIGSNRVP